MASPIINGKARIELAQKQKAKAGSKGTAEAPKAPKTAGKKKKK